MFLYNNGYIIIVIIIIITFLFIFFIALGKKFPRAVKDKNMEVCWNDA